MPPQHAPKTGSQRISAQVATQTTRNTGEQRRDTAHSATTIELADLLHAESLDALGRNLADTLAAKCSCRVLVALYQPSRTRFRLIGDSRQLEKSRTLTIGDPIEQVLTESRILASKQNGTCQETTISIQTLIQKELAHQAGAGSVEVHLLPDANQHLQGAILLLADDAQTQSRDASNLGWSTASLASCLGLHRDAARSWWDRLRADTLAWVGSKRARILSIGAIVLALLMACPVPYQIAANCQCEPATRRILTAPFDSQLEACLVKPGDRVAAGQVLATFEGRSIASEIESLAAEEKQANQNYDAAVATGESVKAAEAILELERLGGRIAILRRRHSKLELRSPIEGVVVSGDLKEAVGATLSTGQQLFEIAPLDRLTAEIAIDESDISLISVGDNVTVAFKGSPGESYTAQLERVFPRAEVLDGNIVFISEARVEGNLNLLSPGMRGEAQVDVGWRPLAWKLFRTPYQAMRRFWGQY